jgi:AcrR family transcriptional regulator
MNQLDFMKKQLESMNKNQRDGITMIKNRDSKRPRTRIGRPPKDLAGDVKQRILDAAERAFLEQGFQSASIDDIAEMAPASKPTIYAHFAGKEALFSAVVARIITGLADFDGYVTKGRTVQDKLTSLGTEIVERAIKDLVGVTRATIAEANRLPELSRHLHEASRDKAAAAVSQLLSNATQPLSRTSKGPFSPKRSVATAQIFMDLILLPMLMRSLMGDEASVVRKDLPSFVRDRVNFFLAACEGDWGK